MENQTYSHKNSEKVPLKEFLKIIKRKKYSFLAFVLISGLLGILFAFTAKPIYQTEVSILIGTENPQMVLKEEFIPLGRRKLNYFKTIHALLRSSTLVKSVIQKLNIENSEEFKKKYSPFSINNFLSSIGSYLEFQTHSFLAKLGVKEKIPEPKSDLNNPYPVLVRKFLNKLIISPISGSHVVQIGFQGFSPELITKITNTYIDNFIIQNNQLRNLILGKSGDWMEIQLKELKETIKVSEATLQNFIKDKNIVEFKNNRDATYRNFQKHYDGVRAAEKEVLETKALLNQIETLEGNPVDQVLNIPDSHQNTAVKRLIDEYSKILEAQKIASRDFGVQHPVVISFEQQLAEVKQKFPEELKRFKKSIEIKYESLVESEASLRKTLENQKRLVMESDEIKNEYQKIKNDLDTNQQFYTNFFKRYKEVKLSSISNESNIKIIDRAEIPDRPIKPKKGMIAIISLFFGVFGGSVFVILLDSIKKTINTSEDIETECDYPLLGTIRNFDPKIERLPVLDVNSSLAEDFRILKTKLSLTGLKNQNTVSLVTSATPGQGKTTIASNLGISFAQARKKVLLIDTDFMMPMLHTKFQIENEPGLMDYFEGSKKPKEIIHETKYDGVFVIPRGNLNFNVSNEYFKPELFESLIHGLKPDFDFIFVDSLPIMASHLATLVALSCDAVIIVIKPGSENKDQMNKTLHRFNLATHKINSSKEYPEFQHDINLPISNNVGSKILGIVLNGGNDEGIDYYSLYKFPPPAHFKPKP